VNQNLEMEMKSNSWWCYLLKVYLIVSGIELLICKNTKSVSYREQYFEMNIQYLLCFAFYSVLFLRFTTHWSRILLNMKNNESADASINMPPPLQ